jgi:hypothetical protein
MCVGLSDIERLVEPDGRSEKLTSEVEQLWAEVPTDINQVSGRRVRERALLAVTFAQAKYWREFESGKVLLDAMREWKERKKKLQARSIDPHFDWLAKFHTVPEVRRGLGMSAKGLRNLIRRLKIKLLKCPNKWKEADIFSPGDSLRVLDSHLNRQRSHENYPAEMIWTSYAINHAQTPGFARLKSILKKHGAKCEPRPDECITAPQA